MSYYCAREKSESERYFFAACVHGFGFGFTSLFDKSKTKDLWLVRAIASLGDWCVYIDGNGMDEWMPQQMDCLVLLVYNGLSSL
jgi:hypothetical protein